MDSIITKQTAKVISVNGNAYVLVNGKSIALADMAEINAGTKIFLPEGATAILTLEDGNILPIGQNVESNESNTPNTTADEIAALQDLIAQGIDPTEDLEAPAAGGTPASGAGSWSAVAISRDGAETIAQAGFDTNGIANDFGTAAVFREENTRISDADDAVTPPAPEPTIDATFTLSSTTNGEDVVEGGQLTYTVTLDQVAQENIIVSLSNGVTILVAAGETSGSVTVDVREDDLYKQDNDELTVTIQGISENSFDSLTTEGTVTNTVVDDNDAPTITLVGDTNVLEGSFAEYTITLSAPPSETMTIKVKIAHITTEDGDVIPLEKEVTFQTGQTQATFTVDALNDNLYEGEYGEIFNVSVIEIVGGGFENPPEMPPSIETIIGPDDDDRPDLTVTGGGQVNEDDTITFNVGLTKAVDGAVEYAFTLTNSEIARGDIEGITINGVDLTEAQIDALFAGTYTQSVTGQNFTVVFDTKQDTVFEGDEAFNLKVDTTVGGNALTDNAQGIISDDGDDENKDTGPDDDDRPDLTVTGGGQVNEDDTITFNVGLTKAVDGAVEYAFTLTNSEIARGDIEGITINGVDLTEAQIDALFAGTYTQSVTGQNFTVVFDTKQDTVFEGDEAFNLKVDTTVGGNALTDNAQGIISDDGDDENKDTGPDDDDRPDLTVTGGGQVNEDDTITFNVGLTKAVDGAVEYAFTLTNSEIARGDIEGITINGVDLTEAQIDALFAGTYTQSVTGQNFTVVFDTKQDTVFEGDEAFNLKVDTTVGGNALTDNAQGIISDDGDDENKDTGPDDDDRPDLTVTGGGQVNEDDTITFNVGLTKAVDGAVEYAFTLTNSEIARGDIEGITINGVDLTEAQIDALFAGTYTQSVTGQNFTVVFDTKQDTVFEGDEAFNLKVDTTVGGNALTDNAQGIISDDGDDENKDTGPDDDDRPDLTVTGGGQVNEDDTITFNVGLTKAVDGAVEYAFTLTNSEIARGDIEGITINGVDLTEAQIDALFAGTYTQSVTGQNFTVVFDTKQDTVFEGDEAFNLKVDTTVGGNALTDNAQGIISDDGDDENKDTGPDDDDRPDLTVTGGGQVNEDDTITFNVGLTKAVDGAVEYAFTLTNSEIARGDIEGITINGVDLTEAQIDALFAGTYTQSVTGQNFTVVFDTKQDTVFEGDEAFNLKVDTTVGGNALTDNAQGIISDDGDDENKDTGPDDDDRPDLTVTGGGQVNEDDTITFNVGLTKAVDGAVEYAFTLTNSEIARGDIEGITINGVDLTEAQIDALFAGTYTQSVTGQNFTVVFDTKQDTVFEGDEAFNLKVDTTVGGNALTDNAQGIISDDGDDENKDTGPDDDDRPDLTVTGGGQVNEDDTITFNVGLTKAVDGAVEYAFTLTNSEIARGDIEGITINGVDLTEAQIDALFAGTYTQSVTGQNFTVVFDTKQDTVFEGDEAFNLKVDTTVGGNALTDNAQGIISDDGDDENKDTGPDDDDRPDLTVTGGGQVNEDDTITFNVGLTKAVDGAVEYAFTLTNSEIARGDIEGITINGVDLTEAQIDALFAGTYTQSVTGQNFTVVFDTKQDTVFEGDEAFNLKVDTTVGGNALTDNAQGIISDDDPLRTVIFDKNIIVTEESLPGGNADTSAFSEDVANKDNAEYLTDNTAENVGTTVSGNIALNVEDHTDYTLRFKTPQSSTDISLPNNTTLSVTWVLSNSGTTATAMVGDTPVLKVDLLPGAKDNFTYDVTILDTFDHPLTSLTSGGDIVSSIGVEDVIKGITTPEIEVLKNADSSVVGTLDDKISIDVEDDRLELSAENTFVTATPATPPSETDIEIELDDDDDDDGRHDHAPGHSNGQGHTEHGNGNGYGHDDCDDDDDDDLVIPLNKIATARGTIDILAGADGLQEGTLRILKFESMPGYTIKVGPNGEQLIYLDSDGDNQADKNTVPVGKISLDNDGVWEFEQYGKLPNQIIFTVTAKDNDGDRDDIQITIDTVHFGNSIETGGGNDAIKLDSINNNFQLNVQPSETFSGAERDPTWVLINGKLVSHGQSPYDKLDGLTANVSDFVNSGAGNDHVEGGNGDDYIVLGHSGNNIASNIAAAESYIRSDIGDKTDNGEDGSLVAPSNPWADFANGAQGNDHIFGQSGIDVIFGGSGNDYIDGGSEDDYLRGGSGNDTIIGGSGDDLMRGDDGIDTYVWNNGDFTSDSNVTDTIVDFNHQEDRLDISSLLTGQGAGFDDVLDIDVNGDHITLMFDIDGDGSFEQSIVLEEALDGNNTVVLNTLLQSGDAKLTINDDGTGSIEIVSSGASIDIDKVPE